MKITSVSSNDIKAVYADLFETEQTLYSMPLPGATCAVVGATCTCCSCCF